MLEPSVPPRPEPQRRMLPPASLFERAREQWEDPRVRVGALIVAAIVTGLIWYQLGAQGGADPSESVPTTATTETPGVRATTEPSTPSGGYVLVHVAGAVARPGVVRIRADARVNDAVEAAGGGLPGADLDRLNLAAKLVDGQRVAVAIVGAPAPVEAGTGGVTGTTEEGMTGPININTATSTELEELPGIGPTLAAAIISEREKRGGFKAVGELQDVRGIGEVRYADIKDLVSV